MIYRLAFLTALVASPVLAEQPDLSDLVTDTIGYVTLRDNVILMEGDSMGSFICRFDVDDFDFNRYLRDGSLEAGAVGYVCIPLEEFEKK